MVGEQEKSRSSMQAEGRTGGTAVVAVRGQMTIVGRGKTIREKSEKLGGGRGGIAQKNEELIGGHSLAGGRQRREPKNIVASRRMPGIRLWPVKMIFGGAYLQRLKGARGGERNRKHHRDLRTW